MFFSWLDRTDAVLLCAALFIAMLLLVVVGHNAATLWNKEREEPQGGINNLLTLLYALSGFILAFAFGMSGSRYEKVRDVIEKEANEIGTTILRADLYPDSVRQVFRADFKIYLEAVIAYYSNPKDIDLVKKSKEDAAKAAVRLWSLAAQQSRLPERFIASQQMLPSLNSMFDSAQTRQIVFLSHVPGLIIYMLFICVLTTCFVAGFTSKALRSKDWMIIVGFTLVSVMVIYTTLDLSRPTRGFIKTDSGREAIKEMREMFR